MALYFHSLRVAWLCIYAMTAVVGELSTIRIRRWWVKPHHRQEYRDRHGAYTRLYNLFKNSNHEEFYNFVGMSLSESNVILDAVKADLTTKSNQPGLLPEFQLAVVLNFLRFGTNPSSQSWFFLIGRSTMYKLVPKVTAVIYKKLGPVYMKFPEGREWVEIADAFYALYGYPNCLGALDGKHFEIIRPPHSGMRYFNRKKYYSIVLMAMCDAFKRFTYASVGWPGRQNDSGIYARCSLGQMLERGEINLPRPRTLPGSATVFPLTIAVDGGFPITQRLMPPYRESRRISIEERIFYIRLTEARKNIECAFGMLRARFQVFKPSLNFSVGNSETIILCCMTIHNLLITSKLNEDLDDGSTSSSESCSDESINEPIGEVDGASHHSSQEPLGSSSASRPETAGEEAASTWDEEMEVEEELENQPDGRTLRDILRTYFVTDGDNHWQWEKLQR